MTRLLQGLLLGALSALLGLLPWLLTGARLPLQNLWATDTTPAAMPVAALPFSQYAVTLVIGLLVVGSTVAGVLARTLPRRRTGVVVGALLVQVAAVVQTAVVTGDGLEASGSARLYLALLVGVAVLSLLLGTAALLLVAVGPRAGAVIGVALAAIPLGSWAGALLVPFGSFDAPGSAVLPLVRFLPALAVGLAIVWAGLARRGRAVAAVVALLLLWIAPAVATAVTVAAGTRAYAHDPVAIVEVGRAVLVAALLAPDAALPPLLVAVVVAAAGLALRRARARREPAPATD